MKKKNKFSVLKLTAEQKQELEKKAESLGLSMTQMIIFGALRAIKIDVKANPEMLSSVQIRLTPEVHSELEKKSEKLNMNMTDLIKIGLENSFDIEL